MDGIRIPVFISYKVRIKALSKDSIKINGPITTAMVTIGVGGTDEVQSNSNSTIKLEKGSKMIINGKTHFAEGCYIRNRGVIEIGRDFSANKNFIISCLDHIKVGNSAMIGWNVKMLDGDGHTVLHNGVEAKAVDEIIIGDHCWICSEAHILKGTVIDNNCIVAYRALVTGSKHKCNMLIGGIPAKDIKENVNWKE